ncbi:YdcF family protein [Microcoleus sp. FACHB-831]|uniref:ElyC/SanA/YdcF family protein n=1 Tax=Microcoleus sp. FACHB-831 TaxID=2692827 RepID=UPI001687F3C8|nr:ElyC/SanA/YdcF family protein [Microcoleus sp. FACHB-831]MBD1923857.1 YdcF family protein [Microcoleus sp. FACHB-831]
MNVNKIKNIRLIHRKEMWTLTFQGWIVTLLCIAALSLGIVTNLHSFLSVSSPVQADILAVEGWLPDEALKGAIAEFNSHSYKKLITTGLPLLKGSYLAEYNNFAELAAATLIALGFDQQNLVAVPATDVIKYRTYAGAAALRQWLEKSDLKGKSINIYTLGVHARRSWLIFKQVLAPIEVGVIAAKPIDYDPKKWWNYSAGVRSVIDETIAYIYARLVNWQI